MFQFKKNSKQFIAFLLLASMLYAQVAIANHAPSHLNHMLASLVEHDKHANHPEKSHSNSIECPEGILAQSLQSALPFDSTVYISLSLTCVSVISHQNPVISLRVSTPYHARAPPFFFI